MTLTTPLACLVGFALWAVALVSVVATIRALQVVMRKVRANEFPSGQKHGGDMYWRLNRAHMNAAENLPIFAALVLAGTLAGVSAPLFSTLSLVTLCARVLQSSVHIASGSVLAVNVRFAAFCVQLGCFATMGLMILGAV